MLVHVAACYLLIFAVSLLIYFIYPDFVQLILLHNKGVRLNYNQYYKLIYWTAYSGLFAMLVGVIISFVLSFIFKWYWINSVIVFVVALSLFRFRSFAWDYLHHVFLTPAAILKLKISASLLVNGAIMFIIGLLLFFLPASIRFINRGSANA